MFLGRVAKSGDPAWLDTDRAYALAWTQDKKATCRCGTRADEWVDDEDAYISAHYTCPGCVRLQEHAANNLDRIGDRVLPGQHPYLERRDVHELRQEAKRDLPLNAD